jgi:uncharacterized RDD family membrane protein YckC
MIIATPAIPSPHENRLTAGPPGPPPLGAPRVPPPPPGFGPPGAYPPPPPGWNPGPYPPPPSTSGGMKPVLAGGRPYWLAPYLDRFLALLIDQAILGAVTMIPMFLIWMLMIPIGIALGGSQPNEQAAGVFGVIAVLLFLVIMIVMVLVNVWYWTYFLAGERWSTAVGQTLGCKVMRIMIIKTDGSPVSAGDGLLRFLGALACGAVMDLGYLWILINDQNQGWHDLIAGTYVIKI